MLDSLPAPRRLLGALLTCALFLVCAAPPAASTPPQPAPTCRSAPCQGDQKPVVILSYWMGRDLPRLVRAIERSGLPGGTPIYYGNYWGSGKPSGPKPPKGRKKRKVICGRQAPI